MEWNKLIDTRRRVVDQIKHDILPVLLRTYELDEDCWWEDKTSKLILRDIMRISILYSWGSIAQAVGKTESQCINKVKV